MISSMALSLKAEVFLPEETSRSFSTSCLVRTSGSDFHVLGESTKAAVFSLTTCSATRNFQNVFMAARFRAIDEEFSLRSFRCIMKDNMSSRVAVTKLFFRLTRKSSNLLRSEEYDFTVFTLTPLSTSRKYIKLFTCSCIFLTAPYPERKLFFHETPRVPYRGLRAVPRKNLDMIRQAHKFFVYTLQYLLQIPSWKIGPAYALEKKSIPRKNTIFAF